MAAKATYDYLGGTTLTSRAQTISLASIPSTYTDLAVFLTGAFQNNVTGASSSMNIFLQLNDDTTNQIVNYGYVYTNGANYGKGYGASDNSAGGINGVYLTTGSNWHSDRTSGEIVHIADYSSTSKYKTILTRDLRIHGGFGIPNTYVQGTCAVYKTLTAINKITMSSQSTTNKFEIGTQLSVFGIERA